MSRSFRAAAAEACCNSGSIASYPWIKRVYIVGTYGNKSEWIQLRITLFRPSNQIVHFQQFTSLEKVLHIAVCNMKNTISRQWHQSVTYPSEHRYSAICFGWILRVRFTPSLPDSPHTEFGNEFNLQNI